MTGQRGLGASSANAIPPHELLSRIYESMTDGVMICGRDGRICFSNPSMAILVGRPSENLIGKTPEDFLLGGATNSNLSSTTTELRVKRPNGTERFVTLKSFVLEGEEGYSIRIYRDVTRSRRTRKALDEAREWFDGFMRNSMAVTFVKDAAGRYVFANEQWDRVFRTRPEHLIGKTDHELWPPEIARDLMQNDRMVREQGIPLHLIECVPVNGEVHEWLVIKFPLGDEANGRLTAGMAVDITETRRTETELRRQLKAERRVEEVVNRLCHPQFTDSQPILQILCEVAHCDHTWLVKRRDEDRATSSNQWIIERSGGNSTGDMLTAAPILASLLEEYRPESGAMAFDSLSADGSPEKPSGRAMEALGVGALLFAPIRGGSNETIRGMVVLGARRSRARWNDEAVRLCRMVGYLFATYWTCKDAEENARHAHLTFAELIESSPSAILSLNKGGNVTIWNPAAEKLLGWTRKEVLGKKPPYVPTAEVQSFLAQLRAECESPTTRRDEVRMRRKNGVEILVEESSSAMRGSGGRPVGVVRVLSDISEQRRFGRMLEHIVARTSGSTGEEFFQRLTAGLAENLGATVCYAAELYEELDGEKRLRTLGLFAQGQLREQITLPLKDTPAEIVFRDGELFVPSDLTALFPEHLLIRQEGLQSYFGVLLRDSHGQGIGNLAILNEGPIAEAGLTATALRLFAARAGAELERRRIMQALRLSDERFTQIAGNIDQVLWIATRGFTKVTYASPGVETLLGLQPQAVEDPRGMLLELIPVPDRQRVVRQLALSRDEAQEIEFRYLHPNGDVRWILARAFPIHDENGRTVQLCGLAEDISQRKVVEARLSMLEAAVEHSRDAVLITEAGPVNGAGPRVLYANGEFERSTQLAAGDVVGKPLYSIHLFVMGNAKESLVARAMRHFQPMVLEIEVKRRDESRYWAELNLFPVQGPSRAYINWVAIIRDISEQRRVEQERQDLTDRMQQSQKMESLGVMASGIVNDFNNLLVNIVGNTAQLRTEIPQDSPIRSRLQGIEDAARRAAALTAQMISLSSRPTPQPEKPAAGISVREVAELVRATLAPGVELVCDVDPEPIHLNVDDTCVRQIATNLVTNAAEAIGTREGTILLQLNAVKLQGNELKGSTTYFADDFGPGSFGCIRVRDTGTGMEPATLKRIFEPFFTTKVAGRGLGLSAILSIVRSNRGALRVMSTPGRGTSFEVYLPAEGEMESVDEDKTRTPMPRWHAEGKILVVDDEESVRRVVAGTLQRSGLQVFEAATSIDALDFIKRQDGISAVILELQMPEIDGVEVLQQIRLLKPKLPVVMLSALGETETRARMATLKATAHLPKPFTPRELADVVRRVLGRKKR